MTDKQLAAWREAAAQVETTLAQLTSFYPECKASRPGDDANWVGITEKANACLKASALERALTAAQESRDVSSALSSVKVAVWNKATSRKVASWPLGEEGGWGTTAWEASR